MSAGRRAALLDWASRSGAFVIEDDYDSEFRFEGRPIPALMGSDRNSNVILVGSFAKLMFPALRIGYIVAPAELADLVVRFRIRTDFRSVCFEQAVLADFIERGHLSRHLHRMRDLYAGRLAERASTTQVTEAPLHPYTKALIASLPAVGVRHDQVTLTGIPGRPPSLINPPPGCRFRDRCPLSSDKCAQVPPFEQTRPGHLVACWRAPAGQAAEGTIAEEART